MILGDALATLELFLHVRNEEVDAWELEIHPARWSYGAGINLGGGFKYVLFSSLPGEMIQFD